MYTKRKSDCVTPNERNEEKQKEQVSHCGPDVKFHDFPSAQSEKLSFIPSWFINAALQLSRKRSKITSKFPHFLQSDRAGWKSFNSLQKCVKYTVERSA